MKNSAARPRVKVSADGRGVVSHAGTAMLREVADLTGLSAQVTAALADTYRGPWTHAPGAVFADRCAGRGTPGRDVTTGQEATVKICGVTVAMPQG